MFSWSASRKGSTSTRLSSTYPGTAAARPTPPPVAQTIHGTIRPPEFSRQEHLDSYVRDPTLSRSTRKVSSTDDSTYDTVFQTTSGEALILRIYFPVTAVRPQMTLVGIRATHAWLDARMRLIGHAALQSDAAWISSRLLLGQAVHEVVQHLQLNPPVILEMTDPGLKKLQESLGLSSSNGQQQRQQQSSLSASSSSSQPPTYDTLSNSLPPPPPPPDMPYIPQQYPDLLDTKSREELQELLDDFMKFEALLQTLPVVQELEVQSQSVHTENLKMATEVLERQEEYEALHQEVTQLQQSLGSKLDQFKKEQVVQDELLQSGKANIYQLKRELNKARKEAFESSEDFAEAWVNGDSSSSTGITVMEFCKQFVAQRNIMHIRAAKLERLEQES